MQTTSLGMTNREVSVTVLGTGRMGTPIAVNLLAAGFPVSAWNRTRSKAQRLADNGARVARTPAEAASAADVVLTMLADGDAASDAMTSPEGALATLAPGSVWVQMGTIGIEWSERLAVLAEQRGIVFVDSPVLGSDGPAREAQLIVLASGPDAARTRVQPIFDAIGRRTMWLGPAGNGTKLKLAVNNWLVSQVEAAAETLALAEVLDLDPHLLVDAIADSPLASPYAVGKAKAMLAGDFAPGFPLRHAFKDATLAIGAASDRHLRLPLIDAVARRWLDAIEAGHGDQDVSSAFVQAQRRSPVEEAASNGGWSS
jgi:3-hydroxyisobutyrate dehydrogenase